MAIAALDIYRAYSSAPLKKSQWPNSPLLRPRKSPTFGIAQTITLVAPAVALTALVTRIASQITANSAICILKDAYLLSQVVDIGNLVAKLERKVSWIRLSQLLQGGAMLVQSLASSLISLAAMNVIAIHQAFWITTQKVCCVIALIFAGSLIFEGILHARHINKFMHMQSANISDVDCTSKIAKLFLSSKMLRGRLKELLPNPNHLKNFSQDLLLFPKKVAHLLEKVSRIFFCCAALDLLSNGAMAVGTILIYNHPITGLVITTSAGALLVARFAYSYFNLRSVQKEFIEIGLPQPVPHAALI